MILPPWAYAAAAVATFGLGFGAAWKVQGWKCDAAVAKGMREAAKKTAELMVKAHAASASYEEERNVAVVQTGRDTSVVREIYRNVVVDAGCAVGDAARGVLEGARDRANASASGEPGEPVPSRRTIAEPVN